MADTDSKIKYIGSELGKMGSIGHASEKVKELEDLVRIIKKERDSLQEEANALVVAQYEISACEAQILRLREALKPFAEMAEHYDPQRKNDEKTVWPISHLSTIGDLRRARSAMDSTS